MTFLETYLIVAVGIIISVLLPIIRSYFPKPANRGEIWLRIRPYFAVGLFSLLASLLIVVAFGDQLTDPRAALLAGYAFDATLQKVGVPTTFRNPGSEKQ